MPTDQQDDTSPENIESPGGPTNDTVPENVYVANPEGLNQNTVNPETDPYDASYNNPPLSEIQVGITTDGTVIPLSTTQFTPPTQLTDLTDLTTALFNNFTTVETVPNKLQNMKISGVTVILHFGLETYSFRRIYIPYPNYISYQQLVTLGQDLMSEIQSNSSSFMVKAESDNPQELKVHQLALSEVTGITLVANKFDYLPPNTPTPVYT